MRRIAAAVVCLFFQTCGAFAEPAAHWERADRTSVAWAEEAMQATQAYARTRQLTALMVVQGDRVVSEWGDVGRKVNVRSVRKSLLSALYGVATSEGRINLASTLAELGVDDRPPSLTNAEKQATVRDLLMARSGIYHGASYETADMRAKRPERGSHVPGSYWFYNNWDFNALGAIYRKATGEDVFQSFAQRIAGPIGMEDYSARDGRYIFDASSDYPAYAFAMSARDLARFGLLYVNGGRWKGAQVVPAAWVTASTTAYSQTDRNGRGYGYLWWVLSPEEWGPGAALASGYGGQTIAIIPSRRLVIVETVDLLQKPDGVPTSDFFDFARQIIAAQSSSPGR